MQINYNLFLIIQKRTILVDFHIISLTNLVCYQIWFSIPWLYPMKSVCKILVVVLSISAVTVGCATVSKQEKPKQTFFSLKKDKFPTEEEYNLALQLSYNKCRAAALSEASRVTLPNMPSENVEVYIQNAPVVIAGSRALPQPYIPDFRRSIAAEQTGIALGHRMALIDATFVTCMNKEGFIEAPALENNNKSKM